MAGPTIVSTSPSSGASGIPTNVTISVIFDQEVDTFRLKNGGIFVEGPDESKAIGPGMIPLDPPRTDEDNFLDSPALKGIVECDFTFERVDGSGSSVDYLDYGTTSGAGQLYRTKVTLTPKYVLGSLTEYSVYIVGDEDTTDSYDYGLSGRSVFDPLKGANIGTGDVVFYGGYTGSVRKQFSVEITTAGEPGTAEYEWWTSVDSIHRTGTTTLGYRLLEDGVKVKFLENNQYEVGDTFTVWCDVPEFMDGSYKFSFTTSSSAPETLPTASTTLTGSTSSSTSTALTISETYPEDRAAFVDSDITTVTVTFSADLDATTVTDSTVTINGHAADGSRTGDPEYTETLTKTLSVSGDVLTITLDPDEVFDNNIIVIEFDETVADTDGNTLAADTSFFFGTEMVPFYAGIRHVRLRLGTLGNYFPDETIALAIWDASLEADAFEPHAQVIADGDAVGYARARKQFVVCFAAWVLASGGGSNANGGSKRIRLGDFDISRSAGSSKDLTDDLKACIDYYQAIIEGGGILGKLHKPVGVVKGDYDVDSPNFGRLWEIPEVPVGNSRVLYSGSRRWYKTNLTRRQGTLDRTRWRKE